MSAVFGCTAGCTATFPLDRPIYRCPSCQSLLEVRHDVAALKATDGAAWRARFDERLMRPPFGSGVWAKREWICPVRDENVVSLGEGSTPLVPAPKLAQELGLGALHLKQCGVSHTGSFKDLGMTVLVSMVKQMVEDGAQIRAVLCASTGDTSAALAAYAAAAGVPAVVILPRGKISTAQLVQPLCAGARVLALDTDFDGCMRVVDRLASEEGYYLANSMNSLRLEGQKTVGVEIVQQLGWEAPDFVVIPGGNLGNVSALGAGFDLLFRLGVVDRLPRIIVAQAEAANPLYRAFNSGWRYEPVVAQTTLASAIQIGRPVSIHKAIAALQKYDGVVEQASEHELSDAAARADRFGFFNCPHTGVALAALEKLVGKGVVPKGARVVVVSTASGLKFVDFKVAYHEAVAQAAEHKWANRPTFVETTATPSGDPYDDVRRVLDAAPPMPAQM